MVRRFRLANVLMTAGIVSVFGAATQAQNRMSGAGSTHKRTPPPTADGKFADTAAQSSLAEIQMGMLAVNVGLSAKVKEFGQKMVDDHGKANDDLKTVTLNKGMTLPEEPNTAQKATLERLSKLHGAAFDSAYLKEMKTEHKNSVATFKKELTSGKDTDIKGFATRTLPVIQSHYELLMKI